MTRNESWVVLVVVAVLAWVGTFTIRDRPASVAVANQQSYSRANRYRVGTGDPTVIRSLSFSSNGRVARVDWYDGDFEPATPRATGDGVLTLEVDGKAVATAIKGNHRGTFEDGPAHLTWEGHVSPGQHTAAVTLGSTTGGSLWGAPYADRNRTVVDGLLVTQPAR